MNQRNCRDENLRLQLYINIQGRKFKISKILNLRSSNLKTCSMPASIELFQFEWPLSLDKLEIKQGSYYNLPNSRFWSRKILNSGLSWKYSPMKVIKDTEDTCCSQYGHDTGADLEIGGGGKPNENLASIFLILNILQGEGQLVYCKGNSNLPGVIFSRAGGGVRTPYPPLRFRAYEQIRAVGKPDSTLCWKKCHTLCIIEFN